MSAEPYCSLPNIPPLDPVYYEIAQQVRYIPPDPTQLRAQAIGSIAEDFSSGRFVRDLKRHFGDQRVLAAFLQNPPMTNYNWHTDIDHPERGARMCAINYLLSPADSVYTLFSVPDSRVGRHMHGVQICPYQRYNGLLFNTQCEHCILNLSDQPRYILSVGFHGIDYATVKRWLLDYEFVSY